MPNFRARQRGLASKGRFLLTDKRDILYHTGFLPTSKAFLLISRSGAILFASELENEAVKARADVVFYRKLDDVAKRLRGRMGMDYGISAGMLLAFRRKVKKARFHDATKEIKGQRQVKDSGEIEKIRKAVRIGATIQDGLRPWGRTESAVANEIKLKLLKANSREAFPSVVAGGRESCYVHHNPGQKRMSKDPVLIDMGAVVEGYHSDRTRMFLRRPSARQRKILEDVKEMQMAIIDFIQPDMKYEEVQRFWEGRMRKKGYGILHSFGHGVGLEIHEPVEILKRGTVMTVEPGVYSRVHGGFRIEDIVVVGKKARILK